MPAKRKAEIFQRAVFLLNAGFPEQVNGVALYNQWQACEDYNTQVSSLLEKYTWFKEDLECPILLCEIVRRCTW